MKKILRIGLALLCVFLILCEVFAIVTGSRNIIVATIDPRCIPHGGMGVFADHDYIETHNSKNAILYHDKNETKEWIGENWQVPQVEVVWRGEVVNLRAPPKDFQLKESTEISFEPDRVDFKNHQSGISCFYERDVELN